MRKFILAVLLLFTFGFPQQLFAEEDGEVGFHIKAIIPDNQTDKKLSYFDLKLEPGQKQTIKFELSNTSTEKATYKIAVNQAYTNNQGFIDYTNPEENQQMPEQYRIDHIAKVPDQLTLAGETTKEVSVDLTMPNEAFDGQILGAIHVMKENQSAEEGQITNNYGYVLGLKLVNNTNEVQRKIELEKVEPAVSFGKTSVVALLNNPTMDAIGHLKYSGEIQSKEGNIEKKFDFDNDMQLAPMSSYPFAIDWDNQRLEAGEYSLHLKITDAKENEWVFDREFKIDQTQANEINKVAITEVNQQNIPLWIFIVGGILIGLVIILLIYLWLLRKKKKEAEKNSNDTSQQL